MERLSETWFEEGRLGKAETLPGRTPEIRREVMGSNHPWTMTTVGNLASVRMPRGGQRSAEQMHKLVLDWRREALGAQHVATLSSLSSLVLALELQKEVFGVRDPVILTGIYNLACIWHARGRCQEDLSPLQDASELKRDVLGDEDYRTRKLLEALGYWRGGEDRRAEAKHHELGILQTRVIFLWLTVGMKHGLLLLRELLFFVV